MNNEVAMYLALFIGLALLVWVGYSTIGNSTGNVAAISANSQYSAQAALAQDSLPSKCGDINDPKNLQHLSHHPDQFQDCYLFVDPVKFKQAVGQDISNFMR